MSSNQLLIELLELSQGVSQFQNLQLLNIGQSSSLFNFSPELLSFVQGCGNSLNSLEQFASSPVSALLLNLDSQSNACLEQLIELEQLFLGQSSNSEDLSLDNSNSSEDLNLSNSTDVSNSTVSSGSADLSNSTASASNASANAAPVAVAQQAGGKADAKKDKKEGKRAEIVQRSGASKKQVLTGLGLAAMMVAGVFAL